MNCRPLCSTHTARAPTSWLKTHAFDDAAAGDFAALKSDVDHALELKLRQLGADCVKGVERVNELADGCCGEHRRAAVDANHLVLALRWVRNFTARANGDLPLSGFPAERDRADLATERSVTAKSYHPSFGSLMAPWFVFRRLDILARQGESAKLPLAKARDLGACRSAGLSPPPGGQRLRHSRPRELDVPAATAHG
jgi:hypothetical protein